MCDSGAEYPSALGRFTAQLANQLEAEEEVTVLHVMSQMSAGPGVRGQRLRPGVGELITEHTPEGQLLEAIMEILEQPGIILRPKVRRGMVVDEILVQAKAGDYVIWWSSVPTATKDGSVSCWMTWPERSWFDSIGRCLCCAGQRRPDPRTTSLHAWPAGSPSPVVASSSWRR